MQVITTQSESMIEVTAQPQHVSVSFELIAYVVLIALALILRFADLNTMPLNDAEARQALAAWRVVYPEAPGSSITPESPLLFLLHSLSFSMLGTAEASVRWMTALAGAFLVFSPLLFRDLLGRGRTFMLVLLLLCSPVLLIASRFDSPVIWSLVSAMLTLWALRQYMLHQHTAYALLATAFFVGMTLLTDPAGLALGLILLVAGSLSLLWTRSEEPDNDLPSKVYERLNQWPWQPSVALAALTVIAISTVFMLYLPGLSSVSEGLLVGLRGFVNADNLTPFFFPLLITLFYEPVTWVFGIASVIVLVRRGAVTPLERFFIVWILAGLVVLLLYDGAGAAHALWITLPLSGLASAVVVNLLAQDTHLYYDVPWWGKSLLALGMIALLAIFTINFQVIARAFLTVPGGSFEQVFIDPASAVWALISILFIILGFFMAAGLWGRTAALRGGALGLLIFGLVTALGTGWNAAVPNAGSAVELWHTQATGREIFILRDTLIELSRRETRGVPRIPIAALVDHDGALAWILRDFINTRFIMDPSEARAQEIALLPATVEPPDLGGNYVGQDFIISRIWNPQTLRGLDFLAWWSQRRTRTPQSPADTMVLWLRQDIYEGVPFNPNPNG